MPYAARVRLPEPLTVPHPRRPREDTAQRHHPGRVSTADPPPPTAISGLLRTGRVGRAVDGCSAPTARTCDKQEYHWVTPEQTTSHSPRCPTPAYPQRMSCPSATAALPTRRCISPLRPPARVHVPHLVSAASASAATRHPAGSPARDGDRGWSPKYGDRHEHPPGRVQRKCPLPVNGKSDRTGRSSWPTSPLGTSTPRSRERA